MEKVSELKPCGCGCTPRIRSYRTYHNHGFVEKYYIYCDGCRKQIPELGFFTQAEAIEAWNKSVEEGE